MLEPIKKRLTEVCVEKDSGTKIFSVPTEVARSTFDALQGAHLGQRTTLTRSINTDGNASNDDGGIFLRSYCVSGQSRFDAEHTARTAGLKYRHLARMQNGYMPVPPERAEKLASVAHCQWDSFASVKGFVRQPESAPPAVRLSYTFPDGYASLFVSPADASAHVNRLSRVHVDSTCSYEAIMAASRGENGGWPALRLRTTRLSFGLSPANLARAADISEDHLMDLEAGRVPISSALADKLAALLPARGSVAPDVAYSESDEESSCSSEESEVDGL